MTATLALFDLDNTLLDGDTDALWMDYAIAHGFVDGALRDQAADMDRRYRAGQAGAAEFCGFFAATLAGRTLAEWQPVLRDFHAQAIRPRIGAEARALVARHQEADELCVMTTATSVPLVLLTARELGFEQLVATSLAIDAQGRLTGALEGEPNMREGKVRRIEAWLVARGVAPGPALIEATFYSDSINDLPLLRAVGRPMVVDPDERLAAEAEAAGWPVLRLVRDAVVPAS